MTVYYLVAVIGAAVVAMGARVVWHGYKILVSPVRRSPQQARLAVVTPLVGALVMGMGLSLVVVGLDPALLGQG